MLFWQKKNSRQGWTQNSGWGCTRTSLFNQIHHEGWQNKIRKSTTSVNCFPTLRASRAETRLTAYRVFAMLSLVVSEYGHMGIWKYGNLRRWKYRNLENCRSVKCNVVMCKHEHIRILKIEKLRKDIRWKFVKTEYELMWDTNIVILEHENG